MSTPEYVQTYTGRKFWIFDPDPADVSIEDIAHHLARLCRYSGATSQFYSVAEHCLHVSDAVAPEYALAALLHDGSEAYLGDITRPLKARLPEYNYIEERVQIAVYRAFGVELTPACIREVHRADHSILSDEFYQLMDPIPPYIQRIDPLDITLDCFTPERAEAMFRLRFEDLTS